MNLKKFSMTGVIAVAMIFGAATPSVLAASQYPVVKLDISGTIYYTTNNSNIQGIPLKKISYNTKTLIQMLNDSPNATNYIQAVTGTSQIPSGSYFVFHPYEGTLDITNKNGFDFPLYGSSTAGNYDFGYLEVDEYQLIGTYGLNAFTSKGNETDKTGIYFYFDDGATNETYIEIYGTATMKWTYGEANGGYQKATLSVKMAGDSNDETNVKGFEAVPASFSATGSGSTTTGVSAGDVPFFYYY